MKKQLLFVAAAAALSCAACTTPAIEKTVYLADYLADGDAETDAVPAITAALADCAATGAKRLVLPGGQLRLRPDLASERYEFISNNDESLKRIAFRLSDMHDFTIDGNGTELLFTGFVSPFDIENCSNITVCDLSVDYTRTFHSEGVIVGTGKGWLDIRFPDEYLCSTRDGILRFRDAEGTVYPYSNLLEFDIEKREPAFHVNDFWLWSPIQAETRPDGVVRIRRDDLTGTVGNVLVFGAAARYNPCFTLYGSRNVTVRDVDIYHCGGMGVIAQCSRNIELERVRVTPAPGKNRMISITADATHFVNCGGYIRMIDCLFENQKDDATNIHGLYMPVERVLAADRLLLRWRNSGQYGVDFLREGMRVELVDNDTLGSYAHRTVKSVRRINKHCTEVAFTEPLPECTAARHLVAADDEYPDVLIRGCTIRNNRARGLLLGSRGHTVIEDNYFHSAGAAILFEGDGNYWYEQSGVKDVVIRGNLFENGNYGCFGWGKAVIAVGSGIPDRTRSRYHGGIVVENNTFRVFDPRIVNLYCVDGFRFAADNRIEMTTAYPYVLDEQRRFVAEDCDNVNIEYVERK
ncbi:MAG: right-handed parallel beta-helix repeat-containing protein [Alistipes sp.]|nr:right-handed parallel beta-helix repeat-containing protein [Alistipes sp.]